MTIKDQLQKVVDRYVDAYRAGDAAGCASVYAENAEMFSPFGPPVRGRAAIEAAHAEWTEEDASGKIVTVVSAGTDGSLAWCLAVFSEGNATGDGTSLNVFERQADGGWLIRICSLNETP